MMQISKLTAVMFALLFVGMMFVNGMLIYKSMVGAAYDQAWSQ
jgi:hypothetical protein